MSKQQYVLKVSLGQLFKPDYFSQYNGEPLYDLTAMCRLLGYRGPLESCEKFYSADELVQPEGESTLAISQYAVLELVLNSPMSFRELMESGWVKGEVVPSYEVMLEY